MEWYQALLLGVLATLATPLPVFLIPRRRSSPVFDRVLWGATWIVAYAGAWLALGYVAPYLPAAWVQSYSFAELPALPPILGAAGAAVLLNGSLWVLDRFDLKGTTEGSDLEEDENE